MEINKLIYWLMDNCELIKDNETGENVLWKFDSEEYSVEGIIDYYFKNIMKKEIDKLKEEAKQNKGCPFDEQLNYSFKYKEALEEIKSPILFMQNRLQKGESLNGGMAIQLAKDANYLRGIAEKALSL